MMNHRLFCAALSVVMIVPGVFAEEKKHWSYSGETGPAHWGELAPEFHECSEGKSQSPINLSGMVDKDLPPIAFSYTTSGTEVLNNGHTVQVNIDAGSTITVDGSSYELKQFHFHTPSENRINGKAFPLECHFVHADANGALAVVALMFNAGEGNGVLDAVWNSLPEEGQTLPLESGVDPDALLPEDRDYYRFSGSLTTPPCSEGVTWLVLKHAANISAAQIQKFAELIGGPNNRPVQPLNGREIAE